MHGLHFDHAASRAEAVDMREALSGKVLNSRMQRVHGPKHNRRPPSRHSHREYVRRSKAKRNGGALRKLHLRASPPAMAQATR